MLPLNLIKLTVKEFRKNSFSVFSRLAEKDKVAETVHFLNLYYPYAIVRLGLPFFSIEKDPSVPKYHIRANWEKEIRLLNYKQNLINRNPTLIPGFFPHYYGRKYKGWSLLYKVQINRQAEKHSLKYETKPIKIILNTETGEIGSSSIRNMKQYHLDLVLDILIYKKSKHF